MVKVRVVLAALLSLVLLALVAGPFLVSGVGSFWTFSTFGSWFCFLPSFGSWFCSPWCGWIFPVLPCPF
jgi:hypothetical protein